MSKHILIGEDSSVIKSLMKKILINHNYEISTAKDGKEVLEKYNNNSYDGLIIDLHMPVMGGMECIKEIRKAEKDTDRKMPIIVVTGNAPKHTQEDFEKAGVDYYLPKPIDFNLLVRKVEEIMNGSTVQ